MAKKSWAEKAASGKDPHVVVLEKGFAGLKPGQSLFIGSPQLLRAEIEALPPGTVTDVADLRARLAAAHGADGMCPLSTSIFLRIVAEAALDEQAAGKTVHEIMPFWRLIDPKSALAKKLSCGEDFISIQRNLEAG